MINFNENETKKIIDSCFKGVPYAKDIVKEIGITKAQAKNGTTKEIIVNRASPKVDSKSFSFNEELEKIIIPKNTKNNAIIEIKEKGNQYTIDETRGNLYIKIHIFGDNK